MNRKQTKKVIAELLDNKTITEDEYNYIYRELGILSQHKTEEDFCNIYIGKLMLKKGNIKEAKKYFNQLLVKKENYKTAYYNLYKVALIEERYASALIYLYKYKDCCDKDAPFIDLSINMLEKYINSEYNNEFTFKVTNNINNTIENTKDEEIIDLYNKIINYNDSSDYNNMMNLLSELDQKLKEKNITIDTEPVYKIIKVSKKQKSNIYNKEETKTRIKTFYRMLNALIEYDHNTAERIINNIEEPKTKTAVILNSYLRNKLEEKKKYISLSDEEKDIYNGCIEKGRDALNNKDYELALDYYKTGLIMTNHPIFYYYIGKAYYKDLRNYDAYETLLKYDEKSGEKYSKCNLYLFILETKFGKLVRADRRMNEANTLNDILDSKKIKSLNNIKNQLKSNKEKLHKKELKMEDYYEYEIVDKLKLIKGLYETGNIKLADKLMNELEREKNKTKEEKRLIQSERNNKRLYMRKSKFN
ncbi:MAG: hypothetical protein E7160_00605 [Firmicutes bacterium]|nr:hypothetical protein [Bacillota bacterium]